MNKYNCLDIQKFSFEDYILIPIRQEDIQDIRKWRNAQIDILRQKKPISENEQEEVSKNEEATGNEIEEADEKQEEEKKTLTIPPR